MKSFGKTILLGFAERIITWEDLVQSEQGYLEEFLCSFVG